MEQVYKAPEASVGGNHHTETYQPRFLQSRGRLGRARYFVYTGLINIVLVVLLGVSAAIWLPAVNHGARAMGVAFMTLSGVLWLAAMIAIVIYGVRRLNDMNASGWVMLLLLVPLANIVLALALLFAPGTKGPNKYGPPPAPNGNRVIVGTIVVILLMIGWLVLFSGAAIPAYQNYLHRAQMEQMHR